MGPQPTAPLGSQQAQPESLLDIAKTMARNFTRSLPVRVASSAVIFVAVWVVHTLLVVFPNEGFAPSDLGVVGILLGQVLALSGRVAGGTAFWFLVSFLISMAVAAGKGDGPGLFSGLGQAPAKMSAAFAQHNLPALMGGAAMGLLLSGWLFNRLDALLIVLLALVALAHGPGGFLHTVVRCGYNDGRKVLSKPRRALPPFTADSFLVGVGLASAVFMISIFLPRFVIWFLAIALLVVAIVLASRGTSTAITSMLGVLAFAFAMGVARQAFGDDGGASEAVGPWITSEGALIAILIGAPPAAGAAVGANIGSLAGGVWSSLPGLLGIEPIWGGADANPGLEHDAIGGAPGDCQETGLPIYAVDTCDLRFSVSDTVWASPAALMRPLTLVWNATGRPGPFGRGWRFSYAEELHDTGTELRLTEGSGAVSIFDAPPQRGEGAVAHQRGGDARLTAWQGGWVLGVAGSRRSAHFEPDGAGGFRLASLYDADGNTVRLSYDAAGHLAQVTDPVGRAFTLTHDAAGLCVALTLPDGRTARYAYAPSGDLMSAVDLAGVESHYRYDERGLMVRIEVGRERNATQVDWVEASWGPRVARVVDANGAATHYAVASEAPRETVVTDAAGRSKRYTSEAGRTTRVVSPTGATGTVERLGEHTVRVTDPTGAVSVFEDDPAGRWRRETDATGAQRVFRYDDAGFLGSVETSGGAWRYEYDAAHRPVARTSPAGRRWTYEYGEGGRIVAETAPDGGVTRFGYDRFGNTASITDPTGAVRRIEYDQWGLRPVRAYDPLGNITAYEYDANDRLVKVVHPDGTFEEIVHGCCAPMLERDASGASAGTDRDAMLRPVRINENGRVTDIRYDATGVITEVNEAGVLTRLTYDAAGNVQSVEGPQGTQEFSYDGAGRVVWTKDALGAQRWFTYDAAGRPTGETDQAGNRTLVEYDAAGRPVRSVNARGHDVRVEFDADGVAVSRSVNGTRDVTFVLDAAGDLLGFDDATGSTRLHPNPVGIMTGIDYPDGSSARAQLNAAGAVTRLEYPGGFAVDLELDARNRPKRLTFGAHSHEIEYDAAGRLARESRSNGVTSTYAYTGADLTGVEHRSDAGVVASAVYQVDRATGRTVMESGHRAVVADKRPQPRQIAYDAAGLVASVDGASAAHDADGNLLSVHGMLQAEYDFANRITRLEHDGRTTEYAYDALGRRASETRDGKRITTYRDLAGRLLAEADESGSVTAWYVWAENLLVARVDAGGGVGFYLGDRQGSTLALVDGAADVVAAYDYDPWGLVTARTGTLEQPFTWQGRAGIQDEGGGVYAIGPRAYLARAARFMQRDLAYPATGWNAYAYAEGNPVDLVDHTGFDPARSAWLANNRPPGPKPQGNFIQTPRGQFRTLSKDEVDQILNGPKEPIISMTQSGLFNMGAGTIGFGVGAAKLIALIGASATPVGWTAWAAAGIGMLFGGARAYAGYQQYQAGQRGENHANSEDAVLDTADPGRIRRLPGRAYDWVCGIPGRVSNAASEMKNEISWGIWKLNQPSTWTDMFGGY